MDNFNDELKKYYDRLRDNIELVQKLTENKDNTQYNKLLQTPQNEKELSIANVSLTYLIDILAITESMLYGYSQKIDLNNNLAIDFFVKLINGLKNNDYEAALQELKKIDTKTSAKLMYDFLTGFLSNPKETVNIVAKKTGFDFDDELSSMQFQLFLNEANTKISAITSPNSEETIDVLLNNDEKSKKYLEMMKHFHILCTNGLGKDPAISKSFIRELKITTSKKK